LITLGSEPAEGEYWFITSKEHQVNKMSSPGQTTIKKIEKTTIITVTVTIIPLIIIPPLVEASTTEVVGDRCLVCTVKNTCQIINQMISWNQPEKSNK
jgi:hypothetical protein